MEKDKVKELIDSIENFNSEKLDFDIIYEFVYNVIGIIGSKQKNLCSAVDFALEFAEKKSFAPNDFLDLSNACKQQKMFMEEYVFAKACFIMASGKLREEACFALGTAAHILGFSLEAEASYLEALKENPENGNVRCAYAELLLKLGRTEAADLEYKKVLEAYPEHVKANTGYAYLLNEYGYVREAEEYYSRALTVDPDYVPARGGYANLLFELGRLRDAEKEYRLAIELDPEDPSLHHNCGVLLSFLGRFSEAEVEYRKALSLDPESAEGHYSYGNHLSKTERLSEAEEHYKIAIKLDPKNPYSHKSYSLFLLSINLESKAKEEIEIASHIFGEKGDRVNEYMSFAWFYEESANKYYNLKDYQKSGVYAETSGNNYIEAAKYARGILKNISLTKGYTLKGRAQIRKLELKPPYEIEKFKEIMSGIYEASKFYKNAAEVSPKNNQTCNACSTSMLCLSEMLDYMLAVMKQKNVPRLEDETEKWKKQLTVSEQIYKGSLKGEAFVQSLYKLMACIENLDKYKKFAMWKEEKAFEECVEELKEIAGNIEGPLQKIIEDSAAQMDVCRRKIMPYAGTETGIFEPETPKVEALEADILLNPTPDGCKRSEGCKKRIKLWNLCNPLIKLIGGILFSILIGIVVTILSDLIMKTSHFEYLLNMTQNYLSYF